MKGRTLARVLALSTLGAALVASFAVAAANIVPPSRAGAVEEPVDPNDLKPPECAGIYIENVVVGSGTVNGTEQNDLILGGAGPDEINGRGGADCILGGGGNDRIRGQGGNDVILGGPGNDTITGNGGYDVCYGGTGWDSVDCEEWPDYGTI